MAHVLEDKNFRLPHHTRPSAYRATLTLDLEKATFRGEQSIGVSLSTDSDEIVLHAIDLTLSDVVCEADGRRFSAREIREYGESQTVALRFGEKLPSGTATLHMRWTGPFTRGLRGLYLAGDIAVTQLEAADARRVFPCFDEPAFKATWDLTLRTPPGLETLANGEELSRREVDGLVERRFKTTPPLSSYLVALACGKVVAEKAETVRGVPVRTFCSPEKAHLARFGQEVALAVLPRLEDYFGLPYAFGKVDQIGVPEFEAGAMENAGLITYREVALLLDPKTAALPTKKRVAEIITHELAHQWFGNWVTMVWWDDLWLNEAFAT